MSEQVRRKLKVAMQENARLKVEIERLTFDPLTYLDDQGEWMPRHTHLAAVERLKAELTDLKSTADKSKAEVERLTEAGDAMASSIQFNEEMAQDYNGPTIVHQSVQAWQAAK